MDSASIDCVDSTPLPHPSRCSPVAYPGCGGRPSILTSPAPVTEGTLREASADHPWVGERLPTRRLSAPGQLRGALGSGCESWRCRASGERVQLPEVAGPLGSKAPPAPACPAGGSGALSSDTFRPSSVSRCAATGKRDGPTRCGLPVDRSVHAGYTRQRETAADNALPREANVQISRRSHDNGEGVMAGSLDVVVLTD
jgi:hypothetical protein